MGKLICICGLVEEKEVIVALKKGAASTEEIQQLTGAGRSCGRCLSEIEEMVLLHERRETKDLQRKLNFGI